MARPKFPEGTTKKLVTLYLTPAQHAILERLSRDNQIPRNELIRQAINDFLETRKGLKTVGLEGVAY